MEYKNPEEMNMEGLTINPPGTVGILWRGRNISHEPGVSDTVLFNAEPG